MKYAREKFDKAVWEVVSGLHRGQVISYGAVARIAGYPRHSRMVSQAMGRCPEQLPWFRVIRSDSTLAFDVGSEAYEKQRLMLEAEGVRVVNKKVIPVCAAEDNDLDRLIWADDA